MGACVHFSRSWPSNSWWQTMVGWQVLSRPSAAEGRGRRTAFTGRATQPYSTTEVDGWQHELSRVSQNRAAVQSTDSSLAARAIDRGALLEEISQAAAMKRVHQLAAILFEAKQEEAQAEGDRPRRNLGRDFRVGPGRRAGQYRCDAVRGGARKDT